jgi:hypothetical protein
MSCLSCPQAPPPQAQQTQQQQDDDMDFNLSSAYEIPDFDLACAYLDVSYCILAL